MENNLDLNFLGSPEVLLDGQPVKFATRKALALFVYLVIEGGTRPRERLQDIFWPESESRLAQPALRNTLARIKKALPGVCEPLQVDGDRVGFNFLTTYQLDLEQVARAANLPPKELTPPNLALLVSAGQVDRGPFMDGFSLDNAPEFEEWLTLQRAIWTRRQNLVYERLSRHQLESRQVLAAIDTVIRWIKLDRLNENAYQRLMRLHFINDNRSAARQVYETCRHLLAQKLGVKPTAQTEEVLAFIRSGIVPAAVVETQEVRQPLHIPFVGRLEEYKSLVRAYRAAQKGQAQVVVLEGEAGIGKTRLAAEFLKWAGTEGADILHGIAYETSGRLSYQSIIDALRERLERENSPDDLLDDVWLVELSRILPELRERYPDLAATSKDRANTRARLFEAVARLFESLAARRPLIWLLDDFQWVDQESLALLHYLVRRWQTSQPAILLLVLLNENAPDQDMTLQQWMKTLTQEIKVTPIRLAKMSAEDLRRLICSMTGENAPGLAELSAWLTAETAGQPFILTETLATLEENDFLIWNRETPTCRLDALATLAKLKILVSEQTLTPVIRDVILARLKWVSQPAFTVLAAAAVIGRRCSFEQLQQVSGIDEQNSLDALDELLAAGMILENRKDKHPYRITHERVREVVAAQLSAARQRVFHRRALGALSAAGTSAAILTHHAQMAKEWQSAFDHSLKAGDEALQVCAPLTAVCHYQSARALLKEEKAAVDSAGCQHLYARLGQAYELVFQPGEALTVYDEMEALAAARGSPEMAQAAQAARLAALHANEGDAQAAP